MTKRPATLRIEKAMGMTDRSTLSLKLYFDELSNDKAITPLSAEDEKLLFTEYEKTSDEKIKTRIIKSNMKFVITVTKKFLVHKLMFRNQKACLEDLINEGNLGLIKAFPKFDYKKGNRFLTFASWDIFQQMQHYLEDTLADIPQPANRFAINQCVAQSTRLLISEGFDTPSPEQIVDRYNKIKKDGVPLLTTNLLAQIKQDQKPFLSSDAKIETNSSGDDTMTISDTFKCENGDLPDSEEMENSTRISVRKILNRVLSEKEREMIEYTYGLNNREQKTLDQLSDISGYTRERVGQILKGALGKLNKQRKALSEAF